MDTIDLLQAAKDFYFEKFGKPPYEIAMGRAIYEELRSQGHVEIGPSWKARSDYVLGMRIQLDPRDPYKIGVEDYRRYEKPNAYKL